MNKPEDRPDIAAAYDRWAGTYDTDLNRTRDLAAVALRQCGFVLGGRDVIEVGCGTGRNTEWLVEQGASVVALDFSEAMLRRAVVRVQSTQARFIRHDVRLPWPVAEASADLCVVMLVLEHVEHIAPAFVEAARALRSGGELFVCELHPMRQMAGRQAEFTSPATGEQERIPAFLHDVSEFVKAGLSVGFELARLDEWRDPGALRTDMPRLLSLLFRVRGKK